MPTNNGFFTRMKNGFKILFAKLSVGYFKLTNSKFVQNIQEQNKQAEDTNIFSDYQNNYEWDMFAENKKNTSNII